MDHELKQRLIGAIVVTALAAIFIPMLFDDPVENSGQQVSELAIPKAPENPVPIAEKKLPDHFGQALTPPEPETAPTASTSEGDGATPAAGEPAQPEKRADAEPEVTEADTGDTASAKSKPSEDVLDTGDVSGVELADDIIPAPAKPKKKPQPKVSEQADEPVAKKKPKTTPADSPKKAAKPESGMADKAHPKPKANLEAKAGTGLGHWSIQAGSFSKKENAEALLEKLKKQGFPVSLQSKGNIYRIKIGPELDKQRASDMKKRLDKQNIQSLMIAE